VPDYLRNAPGSEQSATEPVTISYILNDNGMLSAFISQSSTSQPSIRVISPNSGEIWLKGTTQTIMWQDNTYFSPYSCTVDSCSSVRSYNINLVPYEPPCLGSCPAPDRLPYTIANNISGSSYSWLVGKVRNVGIYALPPNEEVPDGKYAIQVCPSDGKISCDGSYSYFNIVGLQAQSPPSITILSPNGGEKWIVGSIQTISWQSSNISSDAWVGRIALYKGNDFLVDLIPPFSRKLPITGSIQWKVPENMTTGNDFKIEIQVVSGPTWTGGVADVTSDWSDAPFSIANP
jgi:hypothetical protein